MTRRFRTGLFLLGFAVMLRGGIPSATVHAEDANQVAQLLATGRCAGCDLQNAQLSNKNFNWAELAGADFSGAFLYGTTFHNADLKGARFTGADLKGTDLKGAKDADLTGAVTNERTICPSGRPGPCTR